MSSSPPPPAHAFRACTALLSRQLLRPDGVQGLFTAMFGEEEEFGGGSALEKLERMSIVLNAVPANTKPQVRVDFCDLVLLEISYCFTGLLPTCCLPISCASI